LRLKKLLSGELWSEDVTSELLMRVQLSMSLKNYVENQGNQEENEVYKK
jgi:hypothetical protein